MATDALTADESAAVVEAMAQLIADGKHDAAAKLGELAANPAELRKVLAGGDAAPGDAAPGDAPTGDK
jgi:hypothetical protein